MGSFVRLPVPVVRCLEFAHTADTFNQAVLDCLLLCAIECTSEPVLHGRIPSLDETSVAHALRVPKTKQLLPARTSFLGRSPGFSLKLPHACPGGFSVLARCPHDSLNIFVRKGDVSEASARNQAFSATVVRPCDRRWLCSGG